MAITQCVSVMAGLHHVVLTLQATWTSSACPFMETLVRVAEGIAAV